MILYMVGEFGCKRGKGGIVGSVGISRGCGVKIYKGGKIDVKCVMR